MITEQHTRLCATLQTQFAARGLMVTVTPQFAPVTAMTAEEEREADFALARIKAHRAAPVVTKTAAPAKPAPQLSKLEQFHAITDPRERGRFWAANRDQILK